MMEHKDFIEKYGKERVRFRSYYKYYFTFANKILSVTIGGNVDDIYTIEIDGNKEYTVFEIDPEVAYSHEGKELYKMPRR